MFWKSKKNKEDLKTTAAIVDNKVLTDEERDKLAEPKIVRMLNFLKENYDYDGVDYYHYQKPYTQYDDLTIFDAALKHVTNRYISKYDLDAESHYTKEFRETLLNKFFSIKIIHLFRSYGVTRINSYLFIYTTVESPDNIKIIIPEDYNLCNLFDVKEYDDYFMKGISKEYITNYMEFKETVDSDGNYTCWIESVVDILFNISNKRGCISFKSSDETNARYGKLCIRCYPEVKRNYNHKIEYQLSYGKTIIKQKTLDDYFLNRSIANFIFPLNQSNERLDDLGLTPMFTEEYMAQDFTDFISIHDMLKI